MPPVLPSLLTTAPSPSIGNALRLGSAACKSLVRGKRRAQSSRPTRRYLERAGHSREPLWRVLGCRSLHARGARGNQTDHYHAAAGLGWKAGHRLPRTRPLDIVGSMDKPERRLVQALSVLSLNQETEETTFPDQLARLRKKDRFTAPDPETDRLFKASFHHAGEERSDCVSCDPAQLVQRPPRIAEQRATLVHHRGGIATANSVIRNGELRDRISAQGGGVLCVEVIASHPCHVKMGRRSGERFRLDCTC
ncbi:hypothetical protein B0J12DRAFT_60582 [Macrophomina phaseolina]|uniref:Uncharacterized protein n=1 Tax=Macrophomina phaseolina TaxID=35725 RepID=A0ABQ8FQ04_9PEZI|nr:hypothetical protein B0J12DRAFT_60582 [Macrophomina phaseolina]